MQSSKPWVALLSFTFLTKFLCGVNRILTVIAVIQILNHCQAGMSKSRNFMSQNDTDS
jgi:hypothetical protein